MAMPLAVGTRHGSSHVTARLSAGGTGRLCARTMAPSTALLFVVCAGAACSDLLAQAERADPVRPIVERLDFERYKAAIRGLTQFGDREEGTRRNQDALEWLGAELQRYGYTNVERHTYSDQGAPYQSIYATKVGTTAPQEMYMVSAHMDGRGGGDAVDDDASGCAVVLELARVLGAPDVTTTRSVRFVFWNNEEGGMWRGSRAYARERAALQGIETPPGSGQYPEPTWLGLIQHDMMLFDHGLPPEADQIQDADIDIEYQVESTMAAESAALASRLQAAEPSVRDRLPGEYRH